MSYKAEEILKNSPFVNESSFPNEIRYAFAHGSGVNFDQVAILTFSNQEREGNPLYLNVKYFKWKELSPEDKELLRARQREYIYKMLPEVREEEERMKSRGGTEDNIKNLYSFLPPHLRINIFEDDPAARKIGLPPHMIIISGGLNQTFIDHLKEIEKILGIDIGSFTPYRGKIDLGEPLYDTF